jgi:NNP family nitrate/nitrite transporter-like MFS transporter
MDKAPSSFSSKVGLLILVTSIFFLNFLSRILPAPLMPSIEKDLGLVHTEAGGFFLLISIGYCSSLVGSGFLFRWLTHRRIIILSSVATGIALLIVAAGKTLWAINLGLVLLGLVAGAYLPSGITTITSSIRAGNWGKAIAVHELAPAVAYIAAPFISELLLKVCSWQGVLASIGASSILLGLLFLSFGRGGDFKGEPPNFTNLGILMKQPAFWIMMIFFSVAIASSMGVFSMLPLYLVAERGFDRSYANMIIGISRIPPVVMALISGWIADRLGSKRTMKYALLFNGVTTILLGVVPEGWLLFMVFMQPMLSACFFPAGFTVLSRISTEHVRNIFISMTIFFAYLIGAGLIPTGMGILGDAGQFALAISLTGCMILMSVVLFRYLKYDENQSA